MPKEKHGITPAEQSERFEKEVQRLVDAGELNPTEAAKALDQIVRRAKEKQKT